MPGIVSYGSYIPVYRLDRTEIAKAWGISPIPGERAVANYDEDSITMAVEAGLESLAGRDPSDIDALLFATTTAPYLEKQSATIVAAALDLRRNIYTADFTDSTRASTVALRAAIDAIESGSAKNVLLVAADCRPGQEGTNWEQILGDGAAAVVISGAAPTSIFGFSSEVSEVVGPWRRPEDGFLRSFQGKHELEHGYIRSMVAAAQTVLERESMSPEDVTKAVFYSPDPNSLKEVACRLNLRGTQIQDPLLDRVGDTGTAHILLLLGAALDEAQAGDKFLVSNYGDGADAFILEVKAPLAQPPMKRSLSSLLNAKRTLSTYNAYLSLRRAAAEDGSLIRSSPVTYWRDSSSVLRLHGARCRACGVVQYPLPRLCRECGTKDQFEEVRLSRRGVVYTFTLDYLYANGYLSAPVPRAVVDLDGGGRIFVEVTDCDPHEVTWGMPLEMTLRRLHKGANFHNYSLKGCPLRR